MIMNAQIPFRKILPELILPNKIDINTWRTYVCEVLLDVKTKKSPIFFFEATQTDIAIGTRKKPQTS